MVFALCDAGILAPLEGKKKLSLYAVVRWKSIGLDILDQDRFRVGRPTLFLVCTASHVLHLPKGKFAGLHSADRYHSICVARNDLCLVGCGIETS